MSRSPGASCIFAAVLLAAGIASAQDTGRYATAQDAVAARAWADAARIWQREAERGSAEAHMGLGNLWDLGVLGKRDRGVALDHYRKAAARGLPAAAFNVGALLAADSQGPTDMAAAASWYARAALDGHDRAAFALGRLHAAGDGMPAHAGIAAGWLEQAARSIPAAQDALARLDRGAEGDLNDPAPLAFQIRDGDGAAWAEVAWTAAAGPPDARFRVEVARQGAGGAPGNLLASTEARGGNARLAVPPNASRLLWRVMMVDIAASDYAASPWYDPEMRPERATLAGSVRFRTAPENDRARRTAESASENLSRAGLRVAFGDLTEQPGSSSVRYRFAADADLARDIARFLPAMGPSHVERDLTLDAVPGEVVVVLAFD